MAVSRERSFRGAAPRLGLSPSALSHTIRTLEERLGARLLNRTTRSVSLTQAGQALFDRLDPVMAEMENAVHDVGAYQTHPKGVVRVNLPHVAARLIVTPILAPFLRRYPDIQLDLVVDNDLTEVVGKGFDAGIRSGALVQPDMVAVRLTADLRMAVVASPGYFEGHPIPHAPNDILDHRCITYRWSETGVLYRWHFDGPDGPVEVKARDCVTTNDMDILLAAALQGVGLAFLPESFVVDHIDNGELVRVLDTWCTPFSGFHLYYPHKSHMPAALRAFIDFIKLPILPLG